VPDPIEERLRRIGGPRPLPPALRDRLETSMLAEGEATPRPLPLPLRRKLERALTRPRRRAAAVRGLSIAASVILIAAATVAVVQRGDRGETGGNFAAPPVPATSIQPRGETLGRPAPGAVEAPSEGKAVGGAPGGPAAGGGAVPAGPGSQGPPPPFASSGSRSPGFAAPPAPAAAAPGSRTDTTSEKAAFRVGIVRGDEAQEAGFRAYIDLLNRSGGVGGKTLSLIATSASHPAGGTIATVNLSAAAIATANGVPSWTRGPLLETLAVPEEVLRGSVYDFASAPERQAHLAADLAFPSASPSARAAIYYARTGIFSSRIPNALEEVLRARGVTPVRVLYDPSTPTALVPADAVFVSLPPADARSWVTFAKAQRYSAPRGIFGVYSLYDDELARDLPANARVLSPYRPPSGDEGRALRDGSRRALSTSVIHGWATAKTLAVALWRSGADTPAELRAALDGLSGYDNGLMPPYQVRSGTHSRTPEALVLKPADGRFAPASGFRRDPRG
jgi:hypothetical protein